MVMYISNVLTVPSVVTPSDMRLKDNIMSLAKSKDVSSLYKIMAMNVVSYSYKSKEYEDADTASAETNNAYRMAKKTEQSLHYGLLAQELKEIYPELVLEGQDGYLGVNYIELVPILIRSIQELKAELDEIKGESGKTRKAFAPTEETSSYDGDKTGYKPNVLTLNMNGQSVGVKRISQR